MSKPRDTPLGDGGPAFPVWVRDRDYAGGGYVSGGMSMRDYFAAQAMVECIRVAADQTPGDNPLLSGLLDKAATYAYYAADAMLKARAK